MIFKTVVVEDEAASKQNIQRLLSEMDQIDIRGFASSGPEGIRLINEIRPDLVFLDVNLPGFDGFELLSKLERIPHVIFVTAFNKYAVKALESNCVDYLLKPVTLDRLENAVNKISAMEPEGSYLDLETINKLLGSFNRLKRFPVKDGDELRLLTDDDVLGFVRRGEDTLIITEEGDFTYSEHFNGLINRLNGDLFMEVSENLIINTGKVKKIRRGKVCVGKKGAICFSAENGLLKKVKQAVNEKKGLFF